MLLGSLPIGIMTTDNPSNDVRRQLGAAIRRAREAQGLTQDALAAVAGLHRTYVGAVERGSKNISVDNIWRLGCALRRRPSDLFLEAGL